MIDLETIGWLGAVCFAMCGVPQAWESYKNGHSDGMTWGFLGLWGAGEVLTLIYVLPTWQWPLIFNYLWNLVFIGIVMYYKLWPRTTT